MQGSQEGKRPKLWGPRAHFGANISMNTVVLLVMSKPFAFLPISLPSLSSLRTLPILKADNYIYKYIYIYIYTPVFKKVFIQRDI